MAVNKVIYGGNTLVDLTGDTVTAADLADGVKATGADGNPIVGIMQKVTIDAELSTTSTNPVQNKVVKTAIDTVTASIPTKVSTLENDAGYLTQHQSLDGYAKTSVANTWTAEQSLNNVNITLERYTASSVSGTSALAMPTASTAVYTATGNFTLYLNSIASNLANGQTTVFTAYIKANADYALSISVTGVVKYIGNASDLAITSAGLLLNILIAKDRNGITSIVQASKLS